jgi:hypothetical protein
MKKVLFALLACGFAIAAVAQERPLVQVVRPVLQGEVQCAPYFILTTNGGSSSPHVIFAYQKSEGGTRGDAVQQSLVTVQIREGSMPTYQKTVDRQQEGALFLMSQADYDRSRGCLPVPTKK